MSTNRYKKIYQLISDTHKFVNLKVNILIYKTYPSPIIFWIYCFNCVDLTNIDINLPKIQNMTTGISISSCTNINKIDINIPNCTKANSIVITECSNIGYFNLNIVNLQTINMLNILQKKKMIH